MANPSFAEIKEKFSKLNIIQFPKPPTASTNDSESSSSLDISTSERLKTENSNQSIGKI
jgi:hypothetical protein